MKPYKKKHRKKHRKKYKAVLDDIIKCDYVLININSKKSWFWGLFGY